MNILASFPIYNTPEVTGAAIQSLGPVNTFFVVNNPELDFLVHDRPHVVNNENNYCNGGWNQAMEYFLKGECDYLLLSSSDVIMGPHWWEKLPLEQEVWLPTYAPNLELLKNWRAEYRKIEGNPQGACTLLPREAVKVIYPIPETLKLWFGDEYMYGKLRNQGWKLMEGPFTAFHYGSLGIFSSKEAYDVIESDKIAWSKLQ